MKQMKNMNKNRHNLQVASTCWFYLILSRNGLVYNIYNREPVYLEKIIRIVKKDQDFH